mmetsp:Transcript_123560/g.357306  ORF Transcript_123560/g.357306 Transcript_123560/m.357306 type:complete len:261 (+) Transcript_123560:40-822(+)
MLRRRGPGGSRPLPPAACARKAPSASSDACGRVEQKSGIYEYKGRGLGDDGAPCATSSENTARITKSASGAVHRSLRAPSLAPSASDGRRPPRGTSSVASGSSGALVHPADADALAPLSESLVPVRCAEHPDAVLLAVFPLPGELAAVGPQEGALAFLQVVDVLALVGSSIWPLVSPLAVHSIVDPLALVLPAVLPCEGTLALHIVIPELPIVNGAIRPLEPALAMLLSVGVGARVFGCVVPLLDGLPMLQIAQPLADIL